MSVGEIQIVFYLKIKGVLTHGSLIPSIGLIKKQQNIKMQQNI
jgi:hypothetical protein